MLQHTPKKVQHGECIEHERPLLLNSAGLQNEQGIKSQHEKETVHNSRLNLFSADRTALSVLHPV